MLIEILETRRMLSSATLRIVAYNIEDDINGYTTPRTGLATVLEGIGAETISGTAKPIDVLALEETTSNSATITPIVTALNSYYGAGTYAMSTYQATEVGADPGDGNGPNALVYDTKTVTLLASVGVGTPDGPTNGEYRQVVRYEFQPVGGSANSDFYVYVSHYKSGSGTADDTARNGEAQIIRADEATLPSSARVLYVGDFNDSAVAAPAYQTLVASGQGQAFDPANPNNSDPGTSPAPILLTDAATALKYRDDYQMMTGNVLNDNANGLSYVSGSLQGFGNNGSVAVGGSVDSAGNTALPGLANRSAVLQALTTASDHLPLVADFTDPLTPTTGSVSGSVKSAAGVGLGGITVYLDANNNSKLDTGELSTTTNTAGAYSFASVPTGAYIIRQVLPAGDKQTSPSSGYGIHITVASGGTLINENFVDAGTASIAGKVFNDANGNDKQDTGEKGLSGWTLYLDLNNSGSYLTGDPTVTTTSSGSYDFTGLFAGTYIVRVERPSGYTQTTPANNYGIHITLAAGQSSVGNLFGEKAIS